MVDGWIKLHRKFIHWEWYDDPNVVRLFLHCLLMANHEEKEWRGNTIKRGSFITSYGKLSKALNLSVKQIRLAFDKLESTNELERKTTNKSTTVIVCNYNTYQERENKKGKQKTNKGQSKGKQRATTKNDKNVKNEEEVYMFDEFWNDYDNKVGKQKCLDKWKKISDKNKKLIKAFIPIYKKYKPFEDYQMKHPYTFLNSEIWKDDWDEYKQESVEIDMRRFL